MEPKNIKIYPLSPYEQEVLNKDNEIVKYNYFYLSGDYELNTKFYGELKKIILNFQKTINQKYAYNSIYIFKKTEVLNKNYDVDKDISFDSHNGNLLAQILFKNNELYIFYIIDKGNIIYNLIENKEVIDIEFDEGVVLSRHK